MKTLGKRTRFIVVGVVALLVVTGLLVYLLRPPSPVTLHIATPWSGGSRYESVQSSIAAFEERNPHVTVVQHTVSIRDANTSLTQGWDYPRPDIAVVSAVETGRENSFLIPPRPWTGPTWALYYNRGLLEQVLRDGIPTSLVDGTITLDRFESILSMIADAGIIPISVGYQYTWPLAAWIEHLSLAESYGIPADPPSGDVPPSPAWEAALDRWSRWEQSGWIYDNARREDWPRSVIRVGRGEAVFVLIAAPLATTIPFEHRNEVSIVPFPRGEQPPWVVGSLWYLAGLNHTEHPRETQWLVEHLTDPHTTAELERDMNQRFFGRLNTDIGRLNPSLTSDTQSPFMRFIADFRGSWE